VSIYPHMPLAPFYGDLSCHISSPYPPPSLSLAIPVKPVPHPGCFDRAC
jgi:hypothetical protein